MAKQKGRLFLINKEVAATPGTFAPFCGLNTKSMSINTERVDVTTPNCLNPNDPIWRETLAGVKAIAFSGDGQLVDEAPETELWALAMSTDAEAKFQVVVPSVGTFAGTFSINVELSADGSVTFSLSAESTGTVTFTAAA